jgi:hypothetical protein
MNSSLTTFSRLVFRTFAAWVCVTSISVELRPGSKGVTMCTGVRSCVVLNTVPEGEAWNAFQGDPNHELTVTQMQDGRFHVACFSAVGSDHGDLRSALRETAINLRTTLDGLAT